MAAFLQSVTALVNAVFVGGTGEGAAGSWVGSVISTVTAQPILLIGFIMSVAGFAIGAVKRLTRLG